MYSHQTLASTLPILSQLHDLIQNAVVSADCPDVQIMDAQWYRVRFYEVHALDLRVMPDNRLLMTDTCENSASKKTKDITEASSSSLLRPLPNLASLWNEIVTETATHGTSRASNHDRMSNPNMVTVSLLPNQESIHTLIKNIQEKINL